MDWQAQKMNIITGVVIVAIGGMLAYKFLGGAESASPHPVTHAAAFGEPQPAASTTASSVPPQAVPTATAQPPAKAASTVADSDNPPSGPAAIAFGGNSDVGPSQAASTVTPPVQAQTVSAPAQSAYLQAALGKMQKEILQLNQEIQEVSDMTGKMQEKDMLTERHLQESLHRVAKQANPFGGVAIQTHSQIAGYHLQSIGESEAWLSNPDGETVIARAGEHLPGLHILAVTPQGVHTSAGWLGF